MAMQKTPPLGWPHTDALKHQPDMLTAPDLIAGPQLPSESGPPKKKRSCCGVTLLLILIAVAGIGIAIAVGVANLDDVFPVDDFEAAEVAFLEIYPTWDVESADYPDSDEWTVRLVAWDYNRNIGRLAFMDPDPDDSSVWYERPLVSGLDSASQDVFLDAFAQQFSQINWSYVREAEMLDAGTSPEQWQVWYRIWVEDTGEWTDLLSTTGQRDAATGSWVVFDGDGSSEEATTTP